MENNFWWSFMGLEEAGKVVIKESIKDLEKTINEIENEVEEVEILIIKKNSDERKINFKHDGYMQKVVKDMVIRGFKEVKIMHEEILGEI
ncbi:hypothetical protein [Clostridioides sp. ES-S-0001-03]|uniref:hypothetical protein n=1 Tax=Clostridioides sp. ES-S-0001-03 TaxID=2770771 RepID=UPI001D0C6D64|nr:hypothetical protein [Clostridioides sp. ES-S-0001-03]